METGVPPRASEMAWISVEANWESSLLLNGGRALSGWAPWSFHPCLCPFSHAPEPVLLDLRLGGPGKAVVPVEGDHHRLKH